jgi:hypothetical protein
MTDLKYLDYIEDVAARDVKTLLTKEASYKGSWMKRGGVGAFMMLARKWDRIENQVREAFYSAPPWDIFAHAAERSQGAEGLIDDIRDLRCYLLLVEAYLLSKGMIYDRQG